MVRLRDTAVVLVPGKANDSNGRPRISWDVPPTEHPISFQGEQLATSATPEDSPSLAQWRGFLPPSMDGTVTPACRIRWHDDVFDIVGPIVRKRAGGRVRFITVALKAVKKK